MGEIPLSTVEQRIIRKVRELMQSPGFGNVVITVHAGKIAEISKNEKERVG